MADERRLHKKAETSRKSLANILRRAFDEHVEPDVAEIVPEVVAERGIGSAHTSVFGRCGTRGRRYGSGAFETRPQALKRALRRALHEIPEARARITETRERYRAALESFAPHVRAEEQERYDELLRTYDRPQPRIRETYVRNVGGRACPVLTRAA